MGWQWNTESRGVQMKRIMFAALFSTLVFGLTLTSAGCERLDGKGATTSAQTELTSTSSTSVAFETTGLPTSTTKATVKQVTTTEAPLPVVLGTEPHFYALKRYEEDDSHLTWTGHWNFGPSGVKSGAGAAWTSEAGASCTIKFSGVSIALISARGLAEGIAQLTLDGTVVGTVDYYQAADDTEVRAVWRSGDLTDGHHTLEMKCLHTENPASTGYWVGVDAFDVSGSIE